MYIKLKYVYCGIYLQSPKLWGTTSSTASTTTAAVRPRSEYPLFNYGTSWKPEHIGLPGAMARKLGCKGKLNLTISLYRRYMTVNIIKAYYCLDPYQPPASSFIKVNRSKFDSTDSFHFITAILTVVCCSFSFFFFSFKVLLSIVCRRRYQNHQ